MFLLWQKDLYHLTATCSAINTQQHYFHQRTFTKVIIQILSITLTIQNVQNVCVWNFSRFVFKQLLIQLCPQFEIH